VRGQFCGGRPVCASIIECSVVLLFSILHLIVTNAVDFLRPVEPASEVDDEVSLQRHLTRIPPFPVSTSRRAAPRPLVH
jgi:hypothetical protein